MSVLCLFMFEFVIEGYLDKICDQILDSIFDGFLVKDCGFCVVVEMLVIIGFVYVVGEICMDVYVDIFMIV